MVGRDGWSAWVKPGGHDVRVQVVEMRDRLVVGAVFIASPAGADGTLDRAISASDLRDIQLGRLENILNTPDIGQAVRNALSAELTLDPCSATFAEASRRSSAVAVLAEPESLKLEVPMTFDKGDEFYRRVAIVYARAAMTSNRPAVAIAEANAVEKTQVHRWLKEARRRGVVPQTRRSPGASERSAVST